MQDELPTEAGSVIGWSFYYDGPNYHTAVLTYDTRWANATDEYPEFEGLMWRSTHWLPQREAYESLTPDEMKEFLKTAQWVLVGNIDAKH